MKVSLAGYSINSLLHSPDVPSPIIVLSSPFFKYPGDLYKVSLLCFFLRPFIAYISNFLAFHSDRGFI